MLRLIAFFVGALLVPVLFLTGTISNEWYQQSVANYQPTAWYSWPWHFPGAHLIESAFGPLASFPEDASGLTHVMTALMSFQRTLMAFMINFAIVIIPLIGVLSLASVTMSEKKK